MVWEKILLSSSTGVLVYLDVKKDTSDTDKQLELEMPSILNGTDKLLSK